MQFSFPMLSTISNGYHADGTKFITASDQPGYTPSSTNLYIRHMPIHIDDKELRTLFGKYGTITSAMVMRDIATGKSLGTGFVKYATNAEARAALNAMNHAVLDQRMILVQWAKQQHDSTPAGEERKKMNKLFLRNVPLNVKEADLTKLLSPHGTIVEVSIHTDTIQPVERRRRRRIAFVTFAEEGAAEAALHAVHTTCPFRTCNGVPLLCKLSENYAEGRRAGVKGSSTTSETVAEDSRLDVNTGDVSTTTSPSCADGATPTTSTTAVFRSVTYAKVGEEVSDNHAGSLACSSASTPCHYTFPHPFMAIAHSAHHQQQQQPCAEPIDVIEPIVINDATVNGDVRCATPIRGAYAKHHLSVTPLRFASADRSATNADAVYPSWHSASQVGSDSMYAAAAAAAYGSLLPSPSAAAHHASATSTPRSSSWWVRSLRGLQQRSVEEEGSCESGAEGGLSNTWRTWGEANVEATGDSNEVSFRSSPATKAMSLSSSRQMCRMKVCVRLPLRAYEQPHEVAQNEPTVCNDIASLGRGENDGDDTDEDEVLSLCPLMRGETLSMMPETSVTVPAAEAKAAAGPRFRFNPYSLTAPRVVISPE